MYGWRARLGVIVPSSVIATENEFTVMMPEGVTCHYDRFTFVGLKGDVEELRKLGELVPDAAERISHAKPTSVAMCCTAGSFVGGRG